MAKYGQFKYGQRKYGTGVPVASGDPVGWTELDGGNHGGEDWILATSATVGGVHRNVGRFLIAAGVEVAVAAYDGSAFGEFEVRARDIEVAGALIASSYGYRGGAIGSAGEGPYGGAAGVDGGYRTGAGQGDATTDESVVKGSGGGGGPTQPGGAGGALVRLLSSGRLYVRSGAAIVAHGASGGEAAAGDGAGGGVLLRCDGPFGLIVDGDVRTLGGAGVTTNGGTVKEFTLPARLMGSGTVQAGRTYSGSLRRGGVVG